MKDSNFEEILKRKLDGNIITPPPSLMLKIESELSNAESTMLIRPKRKSNLIWGYVAAAASVLVAALLLNLGDDIDGAVLADASTKIKEEIDIREEIKIVNPVESIILATIDAVKQTNPKVENPTQTTVMVAEAKVVNTTLMSTTTQQSTEEVITTQKSENKKEMAKTSKPSSVKLKVNPYAITKEREKKRRRVFAHLSSSAFASGGSNNSALHGSSTLALDSPISAIGGIVNHPTVPELNHKTPINIGAYVGFGLTDRLSIESGLVYSKLRSESRETNDSQYKFKQTLHYLGIPVALRYRLVDHNIGNLYTKGGVMVERIISAERSDNNSGREISENFTVKGVQPSINFSFGAELKLVSKLGLYLEPGISYYFDTNQPDNYRTNNKFSFNISAGVRFLIN